MLSLCAGFCLATGNADAQVEDNPFSGLYVQAGIGYLEDADDGYLYAQIGIDKGNSSGWYISYAGFDQDLLEGGPVTLGDLDVSLGLGTTEIITDIDAELRRLTLGFQAGFPLGDNGSFFYGIGVGTTNGKVTIKGTVDGVAQRDSDDDNVFSGELFFGLEHRFTENLSLVGRVAGVYTGDYDIDFGTGTRLFTTDSNWQLAVDLGVKLTF